MDINDTTGYWKVIRDMVKDLKDRDLQDAATFHQNRRLQEKNYPTEKDKLAKEARKKGKDASTYIEDMRASLRNKIAKVEDLPPNIIRMGVDPKHLDRKEYLEDIAPAKIIPFKKKDE